MGRKGSKLIPFFKNALFSSKYINLQYEGNSTNVFSLYFPHLSSHIGIDCQMILKDWYNLTGRKYTFSEDYSVARQSMTASILGSDFLGLVQSGRDKSIICRLLEPEEIIAKKLAKKAAKKKLKEDSANNTDHAPSVQSSDYGSGEDSPVHYNSDENHSDHALTHAVKHDENYALLHALEHDHEYSMQTKGIVLPKVVDANYLESDDMDIGIPVVENEAPLIEHEGLFAENGGILVEHEGPLDSNVVAVGHMEMGNVYLNSVIVNPPLADVVGSSIIRNFDESHNENLHNMEDGLSDQDSCMQDLNRLFDIDKFLIPSTENYEEILKNASEFLDLKKALVENKMFTTFDPPPITKRKFYECIYRQQTPGMVLLTFQPKIMEFPESDKNVNESDSTRFIFDEATLQMISSCTLQEKKVLSEDHLLLIFKSIG